MKKLFIGLLLVAAAGTGVCFLLRKTNQPSLTGSVQKEWIIGYWKLDSLAFKDDSAHLPNILVLLDSNLTRYHYEFTKDSLIWTSLGDSLTADSARYAWSNADELVWKDAAADSLKVLTLNRDSLVLHDRDSTILFFTRTK